MFEDGKDFSWRDEFLLGRYILMLIWMEGLFLYLKILVALLPRAVELEAIFADNRLSVPTTTV